MIPESHSHKDLHDLRGALRSMPQLTVIRAKIKVHILGLKPLPDAEPQSVNTGLVIGTLPEVRRWVMMTVHWPPSLVLSWVSPESQNFRELHGLRRVGVPPYYDKTGNGTDRNLSLSHRNTSVHLM